MEETVRFKNKEKEVLSGYLHVPEKKKYSSGIILSHCFTCSKHIPVIRKMCDSLALSGFLVLRYDFAGSGESEGKFEDETYSKEIEDFHSGVQFLKKQGVKEIGALGHSMGSATTILAGNQNKNIKALVTMGGDSSTQGIEKVFPKEVLDTIKKKGQCEHTIFGRKVIMKKEFFDDAKKHSIENTLKKSKKPICIIHGEKDELVDVENARKLYFYANEPKNITIIPNGDHMFTKHLPLALDTAKIWFTKWLK